MSDGNIRSERQKLTHVGEAGPTLPETTKLSSHLLFLPQDSFCLDAR